MPPNIKPLIKIILVFVVALGVMTPHDTFAKGKKGAKGGGQKQESIDSPNVTQVSKTRITLGSRSYKVTEYTEVWVNGVKGTISDVKVGMEGSVVAGMNREEAFRITVRASNDKASAAAGNTGQKGKKGKKK